MSIEDNRKRYEGSGMEALMKASDHEVCERCYCCDVVWEHAPCWQCGGFEYDDDDDWGDDFCSVCEGEGEIAWKACIGRCDLEGNHEHKRWWAGTRARANGSNHGE